MTDIVERLRAEAKGIAAVSRMVADDKSARNIAAGDKGACYMSLAPEQTLEWEAANEIERLKRGLNIIAQAGSLYGGGWCVAQALGCLNDLDFDAFPETGKSEQSL